MLRSITITLRRHKKWGEERDVRNYCAICNITLLYSSRLKSHKMSKDHLIEMALSA